MHRLHFLTPRPRKFHGYGDMYLICGPNAYPVHVDQLRRIYRTLRKSGWDAQMARFAIYNIMTITVERAGAGYGK